jgi:hypothetical protein
MLYQFFIFKIHVKVVIYLKFICLECAGSGKNMVSESQGVTTSCIACNETGELNFDFSKQDDVNKFIYILKENKHAESLVNVFGTLNVSQSEVELLKEAAAAAFKEKNTFALLLFIEKLDPVYAEQVLHELTRNEIAEVVTIYKYWLATGNFDKSTLDTFDLEPNELPLLKELFQGLYNASVDRFMSVNTSLNTGN